MACFLSRIVMAHDLRTTRDQSKVQIPARLALESPLYVYGRTLISARSSSLTQACKIKCLFTACDDDSFHRKRYGICIFMSLLAPRMPRAVRLMSSDRTTLVDLVNDRTAFCIIPDQPVMHSRQDFHEHRIAMPNTERLPVRYSVAGH